MCVPYGRPRFHPQLLHQLAAQFAVGGQGLCLAARAVQDEHQLAVEGLAERVFGHQRRQFGGERGETGAEFQFGVVAPFEGEQPRFLKARYEGVVRQRVRQPTERPPAPQRERVRDGVDDPRPVPLGVRGPRPRDLVLEDAYVQLALSDPQSIPGRHRVQPLRVVEEAPQPRHVVLEGGPRRGGRGVSPQRVLEGVERDGPVRIQEQRGQQRTPLGAAHGARLTRGVVQNRRTEQPEPEPESEPVRRAGPRPVPRPASLPGPQFAPLTHAVSPYRTSLISRPLAIC